MRLLTKFFALMLISAQPVFSLPESNLMEDIIPPVSVVKHVMDTMIPTIFAKPVFSFPESTAVAEIISRFISPESAFSLPESNPIDTPSLVAEIPVYPKGIMHYKPLILGLGVTVWMFGSILFQYGDKILRELYYFRRSYPNISGCLFSFALTNAAYIYNTAWNRIDLENGNELFILLWQKQKALGLAGFIPLSLIFGNDLGLLGFIPVSFVIDFCSNITRPIRWFSSWSNTLLSN